MIIIGSYFEKAHVSLLISICLFFSRLPLVPPAVKHHHPWTFHYGLLASLGLRETQAGDLLPCLACNHCSYKTHRAPFAYNINLLTLLV
jgi:hypothetical protein